MTTYPICPAVVKRYDANTVFVDPSGAGDPTSAVRFTTVAGLPGLGIFNPGDAVGSPHAALGTVAGDGSLALKTNAGSTILLTAPGLLPLTVIGGLSPAASDVLQYKSGAWANRTMAQLVTDLGATGTYGVTDGTGAHGQALLAVTAFGAVAGIYAAPGDAQPVAAVSGGAAASAWLLGVGGSTAPDVKVTRTGAGTAAVTGILSMTSPALTTPTGIVASDIASGTFAIGRIPTGTTNTTVPLGGVITAAGPQGDASHTQVLTWNAAGQLTTVTNTSIAIAASQVTSGLSGTYAPLASPAFTTQWDVQDGTGGHGQTKSAVSLFGAVVGVYAAPGDAQVVSGVQGGAAATAWVLGVGGSTGPDVSVTRNGTAAATFAGQITFSTGITMGSGINIVLNATTGTKIGTATNQKLGFFNATPIVQGTAFAQTYSTASHTHANITATNPPAGGTGATAGAYDTAAHRDAMITSLTATIADVANVKQVLNGLIDDLQALGLVA